MNPTGMNEIPPNNLTIEQRGMSALALWAAATPPSYPVTQLPSRGKIGHGFTYWVRNAYPQPEAGGYWVKEFPEVDRLKNARPHARGSTKTTV
jgi:hypothetical protein